VHDQRTGNRLIGDRLAADGDCAVAGRGLGLEGFELATVRLLGIGIRFLVRRAPAAGRRGQGRRGDREQGRGCNRKKSESLHNAQSP